MTRCPGRRLRFLVAAALAAAGLCARAWAGTFGTWNYRMKITFSGYTRSEALTNFPMLVPLSTNIHGFAYSAFASTLGEDLQFAASDEIAELNYEIEKWDTGGVSYVWAQVPRLAAATNFICAYWASPAQRPRHIRATVRHGQTVILAYGT